MARDWRKSEIEYLREHASRPIGELARHFGTDVPVVWGKLRELGLAHAGGGTAHADDDPALAAYARGLEALHGKQFEHAAELFAQAVDQSDQTEVVLRASEYIALSRERAAGDGRAPQEAAVDPYLQAVLTLNEGRLREALALCREHRNDERLVYLAAVVQAAAGDLEGAAGDLARAIQLNPKNRIRAFHEPELDVIRQSPEHAHLFQD